jgi:hypothetical protein
MKGITMPIYGIVFSRVMTILTVPPEFLERIHGGGFIKNEMSHLAIYIVLLAINSFIGTFL